MRNVMKAATLESKFPILSVEHDCIISKDADITVCYRVELPELFTVTQAEYEATHSAWVKAIKVLPNYSIVHKQDFFIEESYTPELQKEDLSFLSRSFERHFNERPYLKHTCYLFYGGSLADGRCKRSKAEIALSLEGTWDADHLFELKQSHELYEFYQKKVEECDCEIEKLLKQFTAKIDVDKAKLVRCEKTICKKNAVGFDVESYAYGIWGVNVMQIPGMSAGSVLQLIGELGSDFIEKFDTPAKFCKWCNIVPNNRISGGKLISSRVPKRKNPVGQVFRMCANATRDMKNPMGFYFRRLKSRGGHMSAIVATAHKMAKIFYIMVKNKVAYDESKVGLSEEELLRRKIERAQKTLDALNAKLYEKAS